MSYCSVCGAHHDPNLPCFDRAGEILRDAGMVRPESQMPVEELRKTVKQANRFVLIFVAILGGSILIAAVLLNLSSK